MSKIERYSPRDLGSVQAQTIRTRSHPLVYGLIAVPNMKKRLLSHEEAVLLCLV